MQHAIPSHEAFQQFVAEHPAALIYFGSPQCGVCQALKPKLEALLEQEFPRLARAEVDCSTASQLAAQLGVFTLPVVLVYLDGREWLRKARSFSLGQLREELARPYALYFTEGV